MDAPVPFSLEFITELSQSFDQAVLKLNKNNSIVLASEIHTAYNQTIKSLLRKHGIKVNPRKSDVNHCYVEYVNRGQMDPNGLFDTITTNVSSRGGSGILEVTTGLSGLKNSCKYNCNFCPNERKEYGGKHDISRSYLSNEGVFKAGLREDFDPYRLMIHRLVELETLGHVVDKVEWIIIGGTFHSYPEKYLDDYISEGWRALNTFHYFSRRFQGRYSNAIHQWVQNGGLHRSLREIPEWESIMSEIYPQGSLESYQHDNETVCCARCVGLSIETRPDQISIKTLSKMREYGCTRVQLGIQHLNKKILQINGRDHGNSAKAIRQCLDAGFKIDLHYMIDLPGATPESDLKFLTTVFKGDTYQADYCKLYYCLNLPFTTIRKWYNRNYDPTVTKEERDAIHSMMTDPSVTYQDLLEQCQGQGQDSFVWRPYSESNPDDFRALSERAITMIPPWTRCVRVQRDFCRDRVSKHGQILIETTTDDNELGFVNGTIHTNENQLILQRLEKQNLRPFEIRSREIGNNIIPNIYDGNLKLVTTSYLNNGGREYYISLEYVRSSSQSQPKNWSELFNSFTIGHVRLRIPFKRRATMLSDVKGPIGCKPALIRELHVYGQLKGVTDIKAQQYSGGQGQGFGKLLMYIAECQAISEGCSWMSVISGVGVRGYYSNLGYKLSSDNHYMVKRLTTLSLLRPYTRHMVHGKSSTLLGPAGSEITYQSVTNSPTISSFVFKLAVAIAVAIIIAVLITIVP